LTKNEGGEERREGEKGEMRGRRERESSDLVMLIKSCL